jgi:hypothetical protein
VSQDGVFVVGSRQTDAPQDRHISKPWEVWKSDRRHVQLNSISNVLRVGRPRFLNVAKLMCMPCSDTAHHRAISVAAGSNQKQSKYWHMHD